MKRLFLLLTFSVVFIAGAFAQKQSLEPKPLATPTVVTCGTLTLSISGTDPLCNGATDGTASVVATGGTGGYTYLWTPTAPIQTTANATGLNANTYIIEVWDNTSQYCSGSIVLTNPTSLIVNITPPAPVSSCFGYCDGSATASPTGGTGPFTYSWNTAPIQTTPLATGLCAQLYFVTMTDGNGCVKVKAVNIGQPAVLVANGSSTTINCSGNCNGTASVAPTGGNIPYTYVWSLGGATTSAITGLCIGNYSCAVTDTKGCTASYNTTITSPGSLTVAVSGTNLLCNAVCVGTATAVVTGGTTPYSYSWAPGAYTAASLTGLCANAYTLTVTDGNGCTQTATLTLTQPTALTAAPSGTNINCFNQCDGTVNANAGGGTGAYTYLWAPGGCNTATCSNLCNNTYSVTVTDGNGCTVLQSITLTQPALLTATPSKTDETCPGSCDGTVTAAVAGGTTPYTYSWTPGGCTTSACAGLCAGNYSVTVTDSKGCTATATVAVNPPVAISTNLSSTPASCFGSCNGTVTSATTGGVSPYTYLWSPGGATTSSVSNLCAGNYSVVVTSALGCTATGTVAVNQPALFTASIGSATPNPLNCNGDCNGTALASLNGGTPTYSYAWSNGGTTASITGLCAGTVSLTATDSKGCTATTSVTFTAPPVLSATLAITNASCSAGCNGSITASTSGGTGTYTYSWLPGGQTSSAISSLCAGNYTITVRDNKGCSTVQTASVSAPSAVAANASVVNNVLCSGDCNGSATAAPTGGTGGYTYLWTGGATTQTVTGLCAVPVSVLVQDANGCSDLDNLSISQPSVLLSIVSAATSSCGSCTGSASITTVGGTAPYTYSWSPTGQTTSAATGLCVGSYTSTVTDANGCSNTLTLSITSQISVAMSSSGAAVSCPGSCDASATATPSGGGTPYTYSWNSAPVQTTQNATGLCAGNYTVTVTDFTGCVSTKTVSFSSPATFTTTTGSTSASCGLCNGSATVAASGGTGTLTYSWSGFPVQNTVTATGLCSGDYTVTVADANNCSTTNTVTVGNVPTITDNPSTTLSACGGSGGAICVAPAGGAPAYTYSWAPGGETVSCITDLVSGIYTVTISDVAGCSVDFPIALGTLSGPTLTVTSSNDPTCNAGCDGDIAVSAAGNSPFAYLWNPGGQTTTSISALCAGTYIVQVDDITPCASFSSTTLSSPPQLIGNPAITDVSCKSGNNGSICLSPSGGSSPYTFQWLPGGQTTSCRAALTAGSYSVVIADANGCDDTLLIPVSEPAILTVTLSSTNVTCNGNGDGTATAIVSGGTLLYTYAWSTGAVLPGIVGLAPANYSVTVTDNNGCTATASVVISQPAILTSTITSTNIICKSQCNGTATLAAFGGTNAYTYSWLPGGETTSAVSGLCPGNYAATITDANGCSSSQTVIITEPTAVSATVTTTNATCFAGCDGLASASASGGTGAYTYTWNPGALTGASVTGLCVNAYTLTTSDANGCAVTNAFSISAPTVLQANITSTITACTNTCDGVLSSSPVGGTGAYTFQWSSGHTTASVTGLCAGTYTLTLSDASGCNIVVTTNVGSPIPLTQSSAVSGATCNLCNGSITAVGSGGTAPYSFFWSTGATTGTITGLCAGVYIDTVMDSKGCISIDTMGLSNTTGPSFTLSSTSVTCNGACNGTAAISGETGNGPPWTYLWTFPSGSQTTANVTGLCPNQYFAHLTDVNGCTTIQSVNIIEPAVLSPNPVVVNATCFGICNGSITAISTGGTGAYTYSWMPGGATTASISGQCAGTYTLTLKDANNCSITTTVTIGQNTILTATLTSTNNSCNASCNGTASVTLSGGTSPYSYAWTGGQTTSSATALCANSYTVTSNDAIGCVNITMVTITEPTAIVPNITSVDPLCNGSCNGSVSSAPTGGTSPYTYLWMPGSLTTTSVTGLCAGTYSLTLADANNCSSTNTVTLTDPAVLSSASVVVNASCNNTCDGSINMTTSGGTIPYTFTWASGGQTTEDISGLCSGNYSLTITDANACSVTYTMSIGVTTTVIASAGNDTSFCIGGSALLSGSSANATSVEWKQLPAWTSIAITNTVSVTPPAGVTSYALIAMNGICKDTDTVVVTVNNYPVVVANNTTICAGGNASICASGANAYQWYQLPAWTPIASGTCINVSPAAGTSNYGIIGMNGVCSDTDSVSVTVLAMPVAVAGNDTAFCKGGSVTLCGTLSQNGLVFNWFELPLWTSGDTDTCTTVSPLATTDFGLIVSNGICSDTDTVSVTIYPGPVADAGSSVTILSSSSTILNGSGGGTYLWTPSAGLSSTTNANPTANPTVTTTYYLLVTDTSGCTSIDSVTVTIVTQVVPNDGLSPNGDGINDFWVIPNIEQFPNALVEVYNRWGELLFHSIGYKEKWDATYNGKELPVGTYYFVINLNSDLNPDPITGPITILR